MAGVDSNRGAKRAREARAALGLDPAAPLADILDVVEAQKPVIVAAMPDGVAGACFAGQILWVNGNQYAPRQRFTLAHEFGHAWIGHDGRLEPDTVETLNGRTSNPYEIQANAFAAEFLVPKAGLGSLRERADARGRGGARERVRRQRAGDGDPARAVQAGVAGAARAAAARGR